MRHVSHRKYLDAAIIMFAIKRVISGFFDSLKTRTPSQLFWGSDLAISLAHIALTIVIAAPGFPQIWDDSPNYIAMATGHADSVTKPFANRIFEPVLAAFLSNALHLDIGTGFEIIAVISLIGWSLSLVRFCTDCVLTPNYRAIFILLSPILLVAFQEIYIPDMLHMAAIALFLLAMKQRQFLIGAGLMTALITIRETSLILAATTAFFLLRDRNIYGAILIAIATGLGVVIVQHFSANAVNIHQMPELIYLVLKIPANLLSNVLGIGLWTNSFQWCLDPVFTVSVPSGLNFGQIHQIGFCAPHAPQPLLTAASLTAFGILPALLLFTLLHKASIAPSQQDTWWLIAFWYGAIMTLLGPVSGTAVVRLIGYGWPLFLIALPALLNKNSELVDPTSKMLIGLHVAALWMPYLILQIDYSQIPYLNLPNISFSPLASVLCIIVGVATNVFAFRIMKSVQTRAINRGDA